MVLASVRQKGWEKPFKDDPVHSKDVKLDNNIIRARARLFEYAYCNDFQWFFTGTFREEELRLDYDKCTKKFLTFLNNYRYRYASDFIAVFVCEKDDNGNFHFHGLLGNIPEDHLAINEHGYIDWVPFVKRFGFCSMSQIRNKEACSKYLTKYLTKGFAENVPKGRHLYFRFGNLKQSVEIMRDSFDMRDFVPDYNKDGLCKCWVLHKDNLDSFLQSLSIARE